MFDRFRHGVAVTSASLDVFRARPRLAILPVLSLVTVGSAYAVLAVALLHYGLVDAVVSGRLARYGVTFAAMAVASGVGVFFNAAVVHCAVQQFTGEDPSVRDGLSAAWSVRGRIAKWGLVTATVGTVLYVAEDTVPGVGRFTASILDLAWGLLTFFVVPVIVVEHTESLRSDLRKSGRAFSRTWGESITATIGISLALLPVGLLGGILLCLAFVSATGVTAYALGTIGGLLIVATIVVAQMLGMIVSAALYRYATDDDRVGPLTDLDPDRVFDVV